jgi:penicillin-binding protein 1B
MRRSLWKVFFFLFFPTLLLAGVVGWRFFRELDKVALNQFSGHRWKVPSKVYASPLLLYPGIDIEGAGLRERLARLDYHNVAEPVRVRGEYRYQPASGVLEIYLHNFVSPTHEGRGRLIRLFLRGSRLERLEDGESGAELLAVDLEPEVITGLYGQVWEERRVIRLHEIPALLVKAVLAAEDQRFFVHYGVDLWGIARAGLANLWAGRVVQGGSTLTQQLMKNFFLTGERTAGRKLIEAAMAVITEIHYSKLQILENYLNEIYIGQKGAKGIFGVWEGARFYFGRDPRDLSLGEMALLAGLIKAPNRYSPYRNPDLAVRRRNQVLRLMLELGDLSEEEYQAAIKQEVKPRELLLDVNGAPYFIDFVEKELRDNYLPEALTTEGLSIYTSLDMHLQRIAQEVLVKGLQELEEKYRRLRREERAGRLQGCLIAIQPQTGEIKAMVGGRDYQTSQFNRVTQARRQPGSIFKPFVYLAALEQERRLREGRFLPTTLVEDKPFTWYYDDTRSWTPANYKDRYLGTVTLRQALERSLNAATARIAQEVGVEPIRRIARRLGITSPLPPYPSLVLGAVEVTPLEIAQAFAVLANQGVKAVPVSIKKVISREGETTQRHPVRVEQGVPPETAYMITHLLEGVLDRGTGRSARAYGFNHPAAGKTGTTNDYGDAWFAGYTPDLLTVVWVGFDDRRESLSLSGAQAALPIWTEFMKRATSGKPTGGFFPPPGISLVSIDSLTGLRATPYCPTVIEEAFFAGEEPTLSCPYHTAETMRMDSHPSLALPGLPWSTSPPSAIEGLRRSRLFLPCRCSDVGFSSWPR